MSARYFTKLAGLRNGSVARSNDMNVLIMRNEQRFGPYPAAALVLYLEQGKLLPRDLARLDTEPDSQWRTLDRLMYQHGLHGKSAAGSPATRLLNDLKSLDLRLILPWGDIRSGKLFRNSRVLLFGGVGMVPIITVCLGPSVTIIYWCLALYFAAVWAIFLFEMFRTSESRPKTATGCFFATALVAMPVLLAGQSLPPLAGLHRLADSDAFVQRLFGMFFCVGIPEELCKAAVIFYLARKPGRVLLPQTLVLYGMISGLGFGSLEGVGYQLVVNRRLDSPDQNYFMNILRLTTLPFLHAIWAGISAYFISFAAIVPRKRFGLWVIAIVVPSLFHALYNTFGPNLLGLGMAAVSVFFLMSYLSSSKELKASLSGAPSP